MVHPKFKRVTFSMRIPQWLKTKVEEHAAVKENYVSGGGMAEKALIKTYKFKAPKD